jgi:hypothetical protein
MNEFLKSLPEWLTALGTLLAVVVALYLARRDKKIQASVSATVYRLLDPTRQDSPEFVTVTVTNVGTRSFTLSTIYWQTGVFKRTTYLMVIPVNEYSSRFPLKLADGDQAMYSIPIDDFRRNSLPKFQSQPRFLSFIWSRFIFVRIVTTTGDGFKFRINRTLRDEIVAKKRRAR